MKRFFLAGNEITEHEKNLIVLGNHKKKVDRELVISLSDAIHIKDGRLDKDDPVLQMVLEIIPLDDTLIMVVSAEKESPNHNDMVAVWRCV